jgi:hypothetical protein
MVSLTVHNAHSHDHFAPIARIDSKTLTQIEAAEGDILYITGNRETVAKCKLLGEEEAARNPNTIWLSKTVQNNAEVSLDAAVKVRKASRAIEAKRIVIAHSHVNEITKNLGRLQLIQHLSAMLSGSPVLLGDYVVAHQPMGSWIVFEVLDIEPNTIEADVGDQKILAIISGKTMIEVRKAEEVIQSNEQRLRRGYPVFWVNIRDGIRKAEQDVSLIMNFWGLHYDGQYAGQFERKISKETDIQGLVTLYTEAAQREVDVINEEARTVSVPAESVKNRILQRWMGI